MPFWQDPGRTSLRLRTTATAVTAKRETCKHTMPNMRKAHLALIEELCAGVTQSVAATNEDNPMNRALHEVKEDVGQLVLSLLYPNAPTASPRRTFEQTAIHLARVDNTP